MSVETSAGWNRRVGKYPSRMVILLPRTAVHRSKKSAIALKFEKNSSGAFGAAPVAYSSKFIEGS